MSGMSWQDIRLVVTFTGDETFFNWKAEEFLRPYKIKFLVYLEP